MSMIRIANLTFAYPGSYDNIFENISVQIDSDWKLGLVGRNGRGKTTLLRLLQGEYSYEGSIAHQMEFDYFPFVVTDEDVLTLEVIEGVTPEAEHWQICRELSLLELSEDLLYQSFFTLSGGERTKVLLAALFLRPSRFMLIDEPTNHLDMRGRQVVGEYLNKQKGFILVSHDRQFLDRCIDHVMSINPRGIDVQKGNYSSWAANKDQKDKAEKAQNEKLKKDIRRLESAARRTADWSDKVEGSKIGGTKSSYDGGPPSIDRGYVGAKAAKMMQRSKSLARRQQETISEKESLLQDIEYVGELKIWPLEDKAGRILEFKNVSLAYAEKEVVAGFDLPIFSGDRIALVGGNGSGKSSLIKMAIGEIPPNRGEIWKAGDLRISYVPQESDFLQGSIQAYARAREVDQTLFMIILRKFGFARIQFEKDMQEYSAGQKKKVLLAASLAQSAHIYIWDEPLNYIDIISRLQVEELLKNCKSTMLFVEHDAAFVKEIATKQVVL